jgi:recombination associated protein RdgC
MAAALMEFRNVKLPKTGAESGNDNNPEEREGMVLERIFLFEELIRLVLDLFRVFLKVRVGDGWRDELLKIREWVNKAERA